MVSVYCKISNTFRLAYYVKMHYDRIENIAGIILIWESSNPEFDKTFFKILFLWHLFIYTGLCVKTTCRKTGANLVTKVV